MCTGEKSWHTRAKLHAGEGRIHCRGNTRHHDAHDSQLPWSADRRFSKSSFQSQVQTASGVVSTSVILTSLVSVILTNTTHHRYTVQVCRHKGTNIRDITRQNVAIVPDGTLDIVSRLFRLESFQMFPHLIVYPAPINDTPRHPMAEKSHGFHLRSSP